MKTGNLVPRPSPAPLRSPLSTKVALVLLPPPQSTGFTDLRIYGYTFLLLGLLKVNGTMPNAGAGAQEPRVLLGTPAPLLIHGGLRLKLSQPQVPIQKKGDKISA